MTDRATFHAMINAAVTEIDALGPMPTLPRRGLARPIHPDAEAWEQSATEVGKRFFLAAWEAAKAGNSVAAGFVEGDVYPATDAAVADYAATKINARWALAIKAME